MIELSIIERVEDGPRKVCKAPLCERHHAIGYAIAKREIAPPLEELDGKPTGEFVEEIESCDIRDVACSINVWQIQLPISTSNGHFLNVHGNISM
ncbi:hypothetical protein [Burkholderia sp. Ac-20345]|uniref:hypothetical protein n=1 Tax=Burkholderia sp. Ac-20345 TaxID=2703891 RepID=UPI00197B5B3D|nr:hypothetical protein [Burkholderia sp. Ac-20345]